MEYSVLELSYCISAYVAACKFLHLRAEPTVENIYILSSTDKLFHCITAL